MTREEAIKQFETLLLHVDTDCVMGMETTEAINMAIKALEQPEPCEDAVSREAAINAIISFFKLTDYNESAYAVRTVLGDLPPVTPKQRTGYWYPVGMVEAVGGESAQWGSAIAYHKCSECDEQALRDDFEQEVLSKWCPHCGVKMVGVSNEGD